MTTTILSTATFKQDVTGAERAADNGPVIITDGDRPKYVLLSHELYRRLVGPSVSELLNHIGGEDIDFDPPRLEGFFRPADLS